MIPLAFLLPLAWNYILIASGKDTRQDVVSKPLLYSELIRLSFVRYPSKKKIISYFDFAQIIYMYYVKNVTQLVLSLLVKMYKCKQETFH